MKIEICSIAIGIPALFKKNCCEAKISEAHDPLVKLKTCLSTDIKKFLLEKEFSNHFEIEFVEQIDEVRGICLIAYMHVQDSNLNTEFSQITLKAEFDSLLCSALKSEVENSDDHTEVIQANVNSKHEDQGDEYSSRQFKISSAFFSRTDDLEQVPSGLVDGECYMFNRFEKSIGVMISSRRTLDIKIENSEWLDKLADAAKVKNSVRLNISGIRDEKISDKARTLLSYLSFKLIEEPIMKIL